MSVLINRMGVIGVGLIGGSFALALKEAGAVEFVVGCGRTRENLHDALAIGAIDDATTDPGEAAADADLVMLAVPVRSMAGISRAIGHYLKKGAIVTDAGSTKEIVLGEMLALLPTYVNVVPGHPIAGSEKTGARAASPHLFKGRRTILTPGQGTDPGAVELVKKLWQAAGSKVEIMDQHLHDQVLGAVSHLPHMVAYALLDTLTEWDKKTPMLRFSAGGLKDFTRIAESSPRMWADICMDNRDAIVEAIEGFMETLSRLRSMVDGQDHKALVELFERCREVRIKIREDEA